MSIEDDIALLMAEREITRVIHRYAQGVDRKIIDQIEACYWPEGVDEHGSGYSGPVPGYIDWLRVVLHNLVASSHQYTNILIDVDLAAGTAQSEAYCLNTNVLQPGPSGVSDLMTSGLRYLDRWERRDGEWRILHRVVARDWSHVRPYAPDPS